MKKETQKDKIARLENKVLELQANLKDYMRLLDDSNKVIREMQEKDDYEFANSPYKKQLEQRLFIAEESEKTLRIRLESLEKRSKAKDKYIQELKIENETLNANCTEKVKNARGAGRKSKLNDKKDEIKHLREEGMKIQELADRYNCSVGKIHKLINE